MTVFHPPAPKAPGATASLVIGIVSLVGVIVVVPVVMGPLAWYLGASARREAQREPTRWSGAGEARAGMILGMIASALLLLLLLGLAVGVAGQLVVNAYDSGYGS